MLISKVPIVLLSTFGEENNHNVYVVDDIAASATL